MLCPSCDTLQPYLGGTDYFASLGLGRLLRIELRDLERRFYQLSRQFHPDFHHQKEEKERNISLENSALLNKAYRTLKDPFARVEYLVLLEEGGKQGITAQVPQEFLEEVFEFQEALEELRSAAESGARQDLEARLRDARKTLEARLGELDKKLFAMFESWDRTIGNPDQPASREERLSLIRKMKESLSYRAYFSNLIQGIEHALAGNKERREIRH